VIVVHVHVVGDLSTAAAAAHTHAAICHVSRCSLVLPPW
jgi:hypothetical protein